MQHILGMLNQALMVLASGNQRSVSRLRQIQGSLKRAAMMQDMLALKHSLADTVRFIEQECARERQAAAGEFATFEKDLGRARQMLGDAFKALPGRAEGIRAIREAMAEAPPDGDLFLVAAAPKPC